MLQHFAFLWESLAFFVTNEEGWKNLVMLAVGGLLIWLAIAKDF